MNTEEDLFCALVVARNWIGQTDAYKRYVGASATNPAKPGNIGIYRDMPGFGGTSRPVPGSPHEERG